MKKDVLLVLGILQGRGWNPTEGFKTIIEAQLDNHKLSTNAFPLTNSPKFNTEITWEAEKKTIRCYKINRVPVKIECYALDEKNNRKSLGYIILPLTTAVEGLEGDSKWYKLLGGTKIIHKTPPSILLSLHLEPAMTLDQHNQVNGKRIPSLKNGTQSFEDDRVSSIIEKKNKLLLQGVEIRTVNTNGSEVIPNCHAKSISNTHFGSETSNGVCNENNKVTYETDSDEVEEIEEEEEVEEEEEEDEDDNEEEYNEDPLDFVSGGCNEAGIKFGAGIISSSYSLKDTNEVQKNTIPADNQIYESKTLDLKESITDNHKNQAELPNSFSGNTSDKKIVKNDSKDYSSLLELRTSAREYLQKLTENSRSQPNVKTPKVSMGRVSSLEKRILETSNILEDSFKQKNKSRKIDNSTDFHSPNFMKEKETDGRDDQLKTKMAQNHNVTSTAFLLSRSIGEHSSPKSERRNLSKRMSNQRKLVPFLNQEEGYFSIGLGEIGKEEEFVFSVTVIYAKNLSNVIPQEIIPTLQEGFHFCYSLLGYSIYTDPFNNLDNPEFLAEKASAIIRSSHESLSRYFSQHYFLPVHFMNGEKCLGLCSIDIANLIQIAIESEAKVEGVYEVNPVNENSRKLFKANSKAVVAVSLELKKKTLSLDKDESKVEISYNEIIVSDSMASSSEADEVDFKKKYKRRKGKGCSKCRSSIKNRDDNVQEILKANREIEREKRRMMHEAAYEVERWKEEQQNLFYKEWSSKEETLQKLLATEWNNKVKIIEKELSHRISECDKLHEKLNLGLTELSVKEENIKLRENQVNRLEQELQLEKKQLQLDIAKESKQEKSIAIKDETIVKELDMEKQKRQQLQEEVSKLREEVRNSQDNLSAQTQEILNLRRKLILSDDIIGVTKEKEGLQNKIESLQERKQYYKAQWLNAITDLHKLHSVHKKTLDEISSGMNRNSALEPDSDKTSPNNKFNTTEFKLRKFIDERKTLLDSGLYSINHSIIKNIDKKIKELKG